MNAPLVVTLDVPAEIQCLGIITASLNELIMTQPSAEPELLSHNVQLAVHEVCMNIIEHAYAEQAGGRIVVTLLVEPGPAPQASRLIVEIRDTGAHSFDPKIVVAPNLDVPQTGGYGLFLVQHLMDEMSYETHTTGHNWRLVKNLEN